MGVSPIQPRDFWITQEAKEFWDKAQFQRIDAELMRLESVAEGYVFDTSTMPWRHKRRALCIWLESTPHSRVLKSIVSHRGRGRFSLDSYLEMILEKDEATVSLYKELYEIDIGTDLSCFDLVLDISKIIDAPTLEASLKSIAIAHSIIRPAVGWYLTGDKHFQHQFQEAACKHPDIVRSNKLSDS
jgi:cytidylate kinase